MGNVMTVPCRSYSAQEFDGCRACVDAALEAVAQAGMYVLGRAAPGLFGEADGPVGMAYGMKVRLYDQTGAEMAHDEIEAEQTVELVPAADDRDSDLAIEDDEPESTMRLDDFQTFMDRIAIDPEGSRHLSGEINGRLFGYELLIGRFEIELTPAD
jgi:hypothetical protein